MNYEFGIKPLKEKTKTNVRLKSLFGLKPAKNNFAIVNDTMNCYGIFLQNFADSYYGEIEVRIGENFFDCREFLLADACSKLSYEDIEVLVKDTTVPPNPTFSSPAWLMYETEPFPLSFGRDIKHQFSVPQNRGFTAQLISAYIDSFRGLVWFDNYYYGEVRGNKITERLPLLDFNTPSDPNDYKDYRQSDMARNLSYWYFGVNTYTYFLYQNPCVITLPEPLVDASFKLHPRSKDGSPMLGYFNDEGGIDWQGSVNKWSCVVKSQEDSYELAIYPNSGYWHYQMSIYLAQKYNLYYFDTPNISTIGEIQKEEITATIKTASNQYEITLYLQPLPYFCKTAQ